LFKIDIFNIFLTEFISILIPFAPNSEYGMIFLRANMIDSKQKLAVKLFREAFLDNESCLKHLSEQRWPKGFVCPECGYSQGWFLSKRNLFDCKGCRHQTSFTAGTIFHNSHVPLINWYRLIFFMTILERGVSIIEMQRLLKIGSYKTAWRMAHKIRNAMEEKDGRFKLAGLVKIDVSYFSSNIARQIRSQNRKGVILCAFAFYRNYRNEEETGVACMKIVKDVSSKSIINFLNSIDCGEKTKQGRQILKTLQSDGWQSYAEESTNDNFSHCKIVLINPEIANRILPWIGRFIANAKNVIIGTHRGVSSRYLRAYLSEIVYRFNHRQWEKKRFDQIIQVCVRK
jgi:hypothetical protein